MESNTIGIIVSFWIYLSVSYYIMYYIEITTS